MQLGTENQGRQQGAQTLGFTTSSTLIFNRKVGPVMWHAPCVKATFVNGAAELSHFKIGAAELRELEEMQVRGGWGLGEREWVEKTETQQKWDRRDEEEKCGGRVGVRGKGDTYRRTAGEVDRGRNRKPGPSIGWDNFPLIAALFGDCWRKVYCPHAAAGEEAIK